VPVRSPSSRDGKRKEKKKKGKKKEDCPPPPPYLSHQLVHYAAPLPGKSREKKKGGKKKKKATTGSISSAGIKFAQTSLLRGASGERKGEKGGKKKGRFFSFHLSPVALAGSWKKERKGGGKKKRFVDRVSLLPLSSSVRPDAGRNTGVGKGGKKKKGKKKREKKTSLSLGYSNSFKQSDHLAGDAGRGRMPRAEKERGRGKGGGKKKRRLIEPLLSLSDSSRKHKKEGGEKGRKKRKKKKKKVLRPPQQRFSTPHSRQQAPHLGEPRMAERKRGRKKKKGVSSARLVLLRLSSVREYACLVPGRKEKRGKEEKKKKKVFPPLNCRCACSLSRRVEKRQQPSARVNVLRKRKEGEEKKKRKKKRKNFPGPAFPGPGPSLFGKNRVTRRRKAKGGGGGRKKKKMVSTAGTVSFLLLDPPGRGKRGRGKGGKKKENDDPVHPLLQNFTDIPPARRKRGKGGGRERKGKKGRKQTLPSANPGGKQPEGGGGKSTRLTAGAKFTRRIQWRFARWGEGKEEKKEEKRKKEGRGLFAPRRDKGEKKKRPLPASPPRMLLGCLRCRNNNKKGKGGEKGKERKKLFTNTLPASHGLSGTKRKRGKKKEGARWRSETLLLPSAAG